MKKTPFIKLISLLILTSLITIYSCSSDDTDVNQNFSSPNLKDDEVSSFSDEVPVELVKTVSLNFIQEKPRTEGLSLKSQLQKKKEIDDVITIPDEEGKPVMYAVNFKQGGYVIISATKKESPILGFSDTANFKLEEESILELGLSDWITYTSNKIQKLKHTKKAEIPEHVAFEWAKLGSLKKGKAKKSEVVIINGLEFKLINTIRVEKSALLKTKWGQGDGYNNYMVEKGCSRYNNRRTPTGCVTTAMAQIMRYYEHPKLFQWGIMPNKITYVNEYNTNKANEVSKLMLGVFLNLYHPDVDCDGVSAYSKDVPKAFFNSGYNISKLIGFNYAIFKNEINNKRPVYMSGAAVTDTGKVAHAWVADGYREEYYTWRVRNPLTNQTTTYYNAAIYFHMNWGWNGSANGWYKAGDFKNPKELDEGSYGSSENFIIRTEIVYGITPR